MPLVNNLPQQYAWLTAEPSPRILVEALKLYGTKEVKGVGNNPTILAWAKEIGGVAGSWYNEDAKAWCGLFMAVCCKRAGLDIPAGFDALRALKWGAWGTPVKDPMLGDILTFAREGGGHVGLYVGEDDEAYHVLGGNQSDQVNIMRIDRKRLNAARRTKWKVAQPDNVRRIFLDPNGQISQNEA